MLDHSTSSMDKADGPPLVQGLGFSLDLTLHCPLNPEAQRVGGTGSACLLKLTLIVQAKELTAVAVFGR